MVASAEHKQVLFEAQSCVRKITLNRPKQLNSLTDEMIIQLTRALKEYESDPEVKVVMVKGRGRAFCAGGDVARLIQWDALGQPSMVFNFYGRQLAMDYLIATYQKPLVFLINGTIMGGGAGLSMNGMFRIVTENTVFAMPEASIGHFPDVGASYFLSRLPGHYGEFLGLTGTRIDGAEMVACGLATHFVLSKDLEAVENELCRVPSVDASTVSKIIEKYIHKPNLKEDSPYKRLQLINTCFSKNTVEEILISLENEFASNDKDKWILSLVKIIKSSSPTNLKLFLKSIRKGRLQTLRQCLTREYNMGSHVFLRTVTSDFFEGGRAIFFDKDKNPKWHPPTLEQVSDEMVEKYFLTVDYEDWQPLQLPRVRSPGSTTNIAARL